VVAPSASSSRAPDRWSVFSIARSAFTVCFGVMSVVALLYFLLKTKVALTLALGSAMAAVAMNHAVEVLERRGLRRSWAIVAVMGG
jgi:predicted PurR-regulated permease PerM